MKRNKIEGGKIAIPKVYVVVSLHVVQEDFAVGLPTHKRKDKETNIT